MVDRGMGVGPVTSRGKEKGKVVTVNVSLSIYLKMKTPS